MTEAVTDAEILWVLDVISSNYSQNSCQNKSERFAAMFKDSKIGQSFLCAGLEITVAHRRLTYGNAVLSNRTLLPLDTMTDSQLQEKEKSLKFLVCQIFRKFRCEIPSLVSMSI